MERKDTITLGIRRFVYGALQKISDFLDLPQSSVVLCYHSIADDGWFYAVAPEVFRRQIRLLRSRGYHFLALSDLIQKIRETSPLPHPFCVITFDDGYRDVLSVREFLQAEGIHPTIFVLAEPEAVSPDGIGAGKVFMDEGEIRALSEAGWDIGCHGATHRALANQDFTTLQHEIIHAREMLKKGLGLPIDYFAYPYGSYEYQTTSFVRRGGYQAALSMDEGFSFSRGKVWRLPRIGINRTYTDHEFLAVLSPLAISFRKLTKCLF